VEGAFRQNLQVLVPFLVLVGSDGRLDGGSALAALTAFGVATLSVIVFRVARVAPGPDSPLIVQYAYRAVSAVAASIGAALTAEGFDLLHADARAIVVAALASGVTAVVHAYADPPATVVRDEINAGFTA
jgi:hypothetical protein